MVVEGRYLSDEESAAGKLSDVVLEESEESVGGTVRFLEKEYAVVGEYKGAGKTPLVPRIRKQAASCFRCAPLRIGLSRPLL